MSTILRLPMRKVTAKTNQYDDIAHDVESHSQIDARIALVDSAGNVSHDQSWLIQQSTSIGRSDADIVFAVPQISRLHATVSLDTGQYYVRDAGSRNGTALNGKFLDTNPHFLRDGDQLLLGGVIQLKFIDPQATPLSPRLGKLDGLWLDDEANAVWINARQLQPELSARQYSLLKILYEANGALISRDEIIRRAWSDTSIETVSNDAVDSLLKRLRQRLNELDGADPVIEVRRGLGIRLGKAYVTR